MNVKIREQLLSATYVIFFIFERLYLLEMCLIFVGVSLYGFTKFTKFIRLGMLKANYTEATF